jgi:type II secretory pathway component GspD/PulD (secretin)
MQTAFLRTIAVLAAVVLAAGLADSANGRQAKTKKPAEETKQAKVKPAPVETQQLKTFELAHADAEKVRATLTTVWSSLMGLAGRKVASTPRLAANTRTRTLFVRGTEKELAAVADLISILDTPAGKALPDGKGLRAVRLQYAKVHEVMQVLSGLGMQNSVVALNELNTLLLPQNGDTNDVRTIIEKLDVEKKSEKKQPIKKPKDKKDKTNRTGD